MAITESSDPLEVVRRDPDATAADFRALAETLERSLRRLERLVDDLLVLDTEDRLPQRNRRTLAALLRDVVYEMRPVAAAQGITLDLAAEGDLEVDADEPLLRRAIANVIENGIKYNHPGGYVRVSTACMGERVAIEITDSGVGIPEKQLTSVFERFWRADSSRSRAKGGAGLGLSIAAEVLERHGGDITVHSEPGVGTTFQLQLPLAQLKSTQ